MMGSSSDRRHPMHHWSNLVDSSFVEINTSNANYFKAYQSSEGAGEDDFSTKRDLTVKFTGHIKECGCRGVVHLKKYLR